MDDLKCKKGKAANKKNDLLIKLREKIKTKRKTKRKENFKKLKAGPNKRKPNMHKDLGRLRIKGRKGMDGMFFKGLRSDYVTRESLNEANEARKNEDLNKIIDIGRGFLKSGGLPGKVVKRVGDCPGKEKVENSPEYFREVSNEFGEDFEKCPLSPISLALTCEEYGRDSGTRERNLDLELGQELDMFSEKYEETVCNQVLLRLPEEGVLEDAVNALRELRIPRMEEPEDGRRDCLLSKYTNYEFEDFKEKDIQFFNDFQFLRENFEFEMPKAEGLMHDLISPQRFLISEGHNEDIFREKSLGRMPLMEDVENYPSFQPDKEKLNVFDFQEGEPESPANELIITTPPIQFYRRNMF